ncbi:MAG: SIS domain-containing protein [Candidatus Thalassarchaeaceae archaeon]
MPAQRIEELAQSLDTEDMCGVTRSFVDDLENAIYSETGLESDLDWTGVIFLGMGGSGSAGRFLKSISDQEGGLPFVVWGGYGLPQWWGPDWLVVATSYSGDTEETIDGVMKAIDSGGTVVGISSGGELTRILDDHEESASIAIPNGQMPRSAFGHILGAQLAVCWSMGILARPEETELKSMFGRIRDYSRKLDIIHGDGMSETLARNLVNSEIGIICPRELNAAAYRLTCQINENSETFAKHSEVPEMNHNEIVAWFSELPDKRALLIMTSEGVHERTKSRIDWIEKNLSTKNIWRIECEGETLLERLIYAAHLSDWVSIALALLRGADPSSMEPIPQLKKYLSDIQ